MQIYPNYRARLKFGNQTNGLKNGTAGSEPSKLDSIKNREIQTYPIYGLRLKFGNETNELNTNGTPVSDPSQLDSIQERIETNLIERGTDPEEARKLICGFLAVKPDIYSAKRWLEKLEVHPSEMLKFWILAKGANEVEAKKIEEILMKKKKAQNPNTEQSDEKIAHAIINDILDEKIDINEIVAWEIQKNTMKDYCIQKFADIGS